MNIISLIFQVPSHKLSDKDRAAFVAKQLYDFLFIYNRETETYRTELTRPTEIPDKLLFDFLDQAR